VIKWAPRVPAEATFKEMEEYYCQRNGVDVKYLIAIFILKATLKTGSVDMELYKNFLEKIGISEKR
jgi:hypothetical protein